MSDREPDLNQMEVAGPLVPIRLPDLGTEGDRTTLSVWWIEVGETFVEGESLVEVSIPGVTSTLTAPLSGTLMRICVPMGAAITPGTVLGYALPERSNEPDLET